MKKLNSKVRIFSANHQQELGIGKYIGEKMTCFGISTPKFRLGKKIIYGYECWWVEELPKPQVR